MGGSSSGSHTNNLQLMQAHQQSLKMASNHHHREEWQR